MKKTLSIIGFGSRGTLYGQIILENKDLMELVAVCDVKKEKLEYANKNFFVKESNCFLSPNDFFEKGKLSDILIISTQDKDHFEHVMKALDLGYDILLEKPISPSLNECIEIQEKANRLNRKVAVCHVLRFTPFYQEIKRIIDEGMIGDVVTISQTENVGYWHQAHSFVRGQWRNSITSAPMILAKCCHDLDIIFWLMNRQCLDISSFGDLYYFKKEFAPINSSDYCYSCEVKDCPYNAIDFYTAHPDWAFKSNTYVGDENKENIKECFSNHLNNFGKCVFKCDNNVVDHQVVNIRFQGNTTAQLTMTAFSKDIHRNIKIHGTLGEIEGDMEKLEIYVNIFGKESIFIDVRKLAKDFSCHGGGDKIMLKDFINNNGKTLTSINNSVHSHKMAFAADESRINNGKVIKVSEE